jgi:hypothetical protein
LCRDPITLHTQLFCLQRTLPAARADLVREAIAALFLQFSRSHYITQKQRTRPAARADLVREAIAALTAAAELEAEARLRRRAADADDAEARQWRREAAAAAAVASAAETASPSPSPSSSSSSPSSSSSSSLSSSSSSLSSSTQRSSVAMFLHKQAFARRLRSERRRRQRARLWHGLMTAAWSLRDIQSTRAVSTAKRMFVFLGYNVACFVMCAFAARLYDGGVELAWHSIDALSRVTVNRDIQSTRVVKLSSLSFSASVAS